MKTFAISCMLIIPTMTVAQARCDGTAANPYPGDIKRHILSIKQGEEVRGLDHILRDPRTEEIFICANFNCYALLTYGRHHQPINIVDHACEFEERMTHEGLYERFKVKEAADVNEPVKAR